MIARAVCATLVAGVFSVDALAANHIWLDDSRGVVFDAVAPAGFVYSSFDPPGAPTNGFLVELQTEDFVLCNYFEPDTVSNFEQIYLRPRHGGWIFGDTDSWGVTGSVRGVRSFGYPDPYSQLTLETCNGEATDSGCGGAALQCFVASANGTGVADSRGFFHDGFDALTNDNESWVSIVVTHWPVSSDDTFNYTVTVHVPPSGATNLAPASESTSMYILKEGYDTSVFDACTALISGGRLIDQSMTIYNACSLRAGVQPPSAMPVVSAALFTNPDVIEYDYSDNVAFGYPVTTQ